MHKRFIIIGALGMALAVVAGAFSAHALRNVLDGRMWEIFNTAVDYQLYHSLGLILIGVLLQSASNNIHLRRSAYLMLGGMLIFSGSLYLLVASGIKMLGMITPIGGSLMIVAWLMLAWSQIKR
jgi:uncharacterized membrane protein YgdD (TMEM256/DUF423 family)